MSAPRDLVRNAALIAAALASAGLLAGCGGGGAFEANDHYMTWLTSRPVGEQIANSAGRTGDEDVDGVLTAAQAIEDIRAADEKAAAAIDESATDPQSEKAASLMDEAIALRPDDMRYRRDRALIALGQQDAVTAMEQWREQDRIATLGGKKLTSAYWTGCESDVYRAQESLEQEPPSPERDAQLVAIYTRLSDVYGSWSVAKQTLLQDDEARRLSEEADQWAAQAARLAP